ncbi:Nucleolar protein 10 [Nowakowskiella sp. JEL0078]|nr:Nucleolar protein 10 [Nowakowskiella sp. JEL0078]
MSFTTQTSNDVVSYSITSGARTALPDWLVNRQKNTLKYDQDWRRRVDLIQDFEFPEASIRLKMSKNGSYIMATGVYKPQFRVFDLAELAMKFDRHTNCENVQFEFGRDLTYHYPSCDLLTVGDSNEVWRLNLDQGRFLNSLVTDSPTNNVCKINPAHQLWGFGGSNGTVEFWHPSTRNRIGKLDIAASLLKSQYSTESFDEFPEITSICFAEDGLHCAFGTLTGHVLLYDMRSTNPLMIKDHQYGFPIKNIMYHSSGKLISTDTRVVKIWNLDDHKLWTAIEPSYDINDVCIDGSSGLLMMANEGVQIQTYYIPQLGPAPRWCPFLDNLTEELEESSTQTLYDDYKFVTRSELTSLGLDHLMGTTALRAYMHGFFVDLRLYEKAKAISNPFEYEEHRRRQILSKINKERSTRISAIKKLPKINRHLAAKLLKGDLDGDGDNSSDDNGKKKKKIKKESIKNANATTGNPLGDDRFASLFQDPEFQVDEETEEYQLHHPSESQNKNNFTRIKDEDEGFSDDDSDVESEPEGQSSDDSSSKEIETYKKQRDTKKSQKFYEIKDVHNISFSKNQALSDRKSNKESATFGSRLKEEGNKSNDRIIKSNTGNLSITFQPEGNKSSARDIKSSKKGDRRGIGELRLPRQGGDSRGRGRGRGNGGGRGRGRGRG